MTFVHAFVEGVIFAGVFAALCTNFLFRDGVQTRLKMKNYKKKNKQKQKRREKKRRLESVPGQGSRASTRRRLKVPLCRSPKQASNLTDDNTRENPRTDDTPRTRLSSRLQEGLIRASTMNKISWSDDIFQVETSLMDQMMLFVESDNDGPIYIVPRNTTSQIYITRHLACRHTVKKLQFTLEYLPTLSPAREVRYYDPRQRITRMTSSLVIINTTLALIHQFPFEALREYTATTTSEDSTQVQWQASKVNSRFTSLMSMGERALNGVPVPKLKQGWVP
jgi:hypothetical protein